MGFGGGNTKPLPPPPAPAPAPTLDMAAAEAQKQDNQVALRRGRAATILTSQSGDLSAPTTATKTLLGQ